MTAPDLISFARATWRDFLAVACAFAALPIYALLLESLQ
jgi:hypothetical protein